MFLVLVGIFPLSPNPLTNKSLSSKMVSILVHHDQSTNQEKVSNGGLKVKVDLPYAECCIAVICSPSEVYVQCLVMTGTV